MMSLVAESLQTVFCDEVKTYLIACVPAPAVAGLNNPVGLTPVPVYINVPGTNGSLLASVI